MASCSRSSFLDEDRPIAGSILDKRAKWLETPVPQMKVLASLLASAVLGLAAVATASAAPPSLKEVEAAAKTIRAVPGPVVTAPKAFVMVKGLPLRVALRLPKGTTGFKVKVRRHHDVSSKFRGSGRERVARLDRSDGLRWGANTVTVIAARGKRPPLINARSFYLARATNGVATLRTRARGSAVAVTLRLRQPRTLGLTEIGDPKAVSRSLEALQRKRTVRLWLNGKLVTRAIGSNDPARWTASLSAAHGLRYGVNRLKAYVAEPQTGRYQVLHRRLVVERTGPLASAGWDHYSKVGSAVSFNGRRSRVADGGERKLRWQIVSKPRGSKATLRGANGARPRLQPDRPGKYVVRLTASEGVAGARAQASASAAPATSSDTAVLTAAPQQLLVPFTGFVPAAAGKPAGIQVGGTFYPKPAQGDFQLLILERSTLALRTPGSNTWFDKNGSGEHSIKGVYEEVMKLGQDQLVVVAMPIADPTAPVNSEQVDEFNAILNKIGVASQKAEQLTVGNLQMAVVGVPYGGEGTGYISMSRGGSRTVLKGWLMPDAAPSHSGNLNFRLVPDRIEFDTEESSTPTTNTMTIGTTPFGASLPGGASGGFQVLALDPFTFAPLGSRVFPTNAEGIGGGVLSGRREMAQFLKEQAQAENLVAVQSIGKIGDFVRPNAEEQFAEDMHRAWLEISAALATLGGNTYVFNLNKTAGSYAFLGGTLLQRGDVADSSSAISLDPTSGTPEYESGTLHGRATVTADGVFEPVIAAPVETPDVKLYDLIFSPPTPWPLTKEAGTKGAARYEEALAFISKELIGPEVTDIRQTYWKNLGVTYSDKIIKMNQLPYGNTGKTCGGRKAAAAEPAGGRPRYNREEFCEMTQQLQVEFEALDRVKDMFEAYGRAFSESGPLQQAHLNSLGEQIVEAVKPSEASEILWSLGEFAANLIAAGLTAGASEEVEAGWEVVVASYEVTRELLGATGGIPVGEQVESKVGELALNLEEKLYGASAGIKRLRQVIISDWGRLQSVGAVAGKEGWSVDESAVTTNVANAGEVFFSSELLPIPYGVWALEGTGFNGNPNAENCYTLAWGHTFRYAPETAKIEWMGQQWVLGVHYPSVTRYSYPPAEITDKIFKPTTQNGYGVSLADFLWESYEGASTPQGPAPPTDIAYCH